MKKFLKRTLISFLFLPLLVAIGWRILLWYAERTGSYENLFYPSCQDKITSDGYLEEVESARRQVWGLMKECQIPGLSISVSKNGQVIWSEAFGYADTKMGKPACPSTQFRINSISKQLTALGVARLYDQGKLDLDKDIRDYLPEFPDKGSLITARQLATHTSGIRSYRDDNEAVQNKNYNGVIESLDIFKDDPLLFTPGTDFQYSVYGYILLSAVVEKAGGKPFLDYMREDIFQPLQMNATMPASSDGSLPKEAHYYDHTTPYSTDGSIVTSPDNDFSFKWASGGFISTADDLVRFGNAHYPSLNKNFVKEETLDILFTPETKQMGLIGYSMGWMTARDLHLRKANFHFGAGSGGTSVLVLYPEQRVAIAILANLGHAKFPFNRLSVIANQFTWSPGKGLFWVILLVYLLILVGWFIKEKLLNTRSR